MGEPVPETGRERTIGGYANDRLHACQSTPLGIGRKRGEQKQAVGRSRGGRNTKIHALADAKGRLIAILLTGGEAHGCPIAERLIRRVKPSKHMLGDKAYDSAELRNRLHERGTKSVIPNRSNRKQPFRFSKRLYRENHRIENAFSRLKDFRRIARRYDRLVQEMSWLELSAQTCFGPANLARDVPKRRPKTISFGSGWSLPSTRKSAPLHLGVTVRDGIVYPKASSWMSVSGRR